MSTSLVCKKYAQALLDLSKERGEQVRVRTDMRLLLGVFLKNPFFTKIFHSPIVSELEKRDIVNAVSDGMADITNGFFSVLERNRRMSLIDGIAVYFERVYKKSENIADILVTSAVPLSKGIEQKIKEKIISFGVKFEELETKLDPSVLGGCRLRINNSVYDDTLILRFSKLKDQMGIEIESV